MMARDSATGAAGIAAHAPDLMAADSTVGRAIRSNAVDEDHVFLSTLPANCANRRLAFAIMLVSLLIFTALAPFARVQLPPAWTFIPSYQSVLAVSNLTIAILLLVQFTNLRSRALLVLATGYLFTAFMIVPHLLTFPDLPPPNSSFHSGPQSAAWLYIFWYAGLPLAVIAYALFKNATSGDVLPQESIRDAVVLSVIAMIGAVCGLALLATAGQASLPALMRDSGYAPIMIVVSATVWILSLMALMVLWVRRPHSMLDLWLMVAMCAWQFDVALSSVLNAERFDLGFYAGRIYGLLAAGIILLVLLLETGAAYARLARSITTERRERAQQLHEAQSGSIHVSHANELGQIHAEDLFRLAVEACPGGIVMIDRRGRIVMVNAETEQMFGYRREELIGQSVDMLVPKRLRPRHVRQREAFTFRPESRRMGAGREQFGVRKNGTEFPVEIGLNPIHTGEGLLILGVIVDISERKHMERLKDEFVSTVSHELRAPLTSISASLGLLAGAAHVHLPATAKRLVKIAHSSSERLVRLINDILDIEKIESGKVQFDLKRVEVVSLAEQTIEANRAFAESCGVEIRLEESAEYEVRADPDRLVQVVTNLLSNAIKFSPRGAEVAVSIRQRNGNIRINVRDHGAGIPESFRPRVFEKFAQADTSDARQKVGTGLGLSIVKQIVLRHGGEAGFTDAPGGGTIFYIELPGLQCGGRVDAERKDNFDGARILFCEDAIDLEETESA